MLPLSEIPTRAARRARRPAAARARAIAAGVAVALSSAGALVAQAPAAPSAPAAPHAPTASVRGVVFDSTAGGPLDGATVQLLPVRDGAAASDLPVVSLVADSLGRFRADRLAPGAWAVAFIHPALDLYGLEMPTAAVRLAAGDTVALTLGIPAPRALRRVLCDGAGAADSSGAVVGTLRDADTEALLEGAVVSVSWNELEIRDGIRSVRRRVPGRTLPGGVFRFCGVPTDGAVVVRAESGAGGDTTRASGEIELTVPTSGAVRLDLAAARQVAVAASPAASPAAGAAPAAASAPAVALRGAARLAGVVRDDRGRPLARARVLVLGTGREATTGDAGTFVLDSLPGGSWTAEARAIGFSPVRAPVTLRGERSASVAFAFAARVEALDRVVVLGKASPRSRLLDELLQRRRSGFGRHFLADDIARLNPLRVSDVLRTAPGVRLTPDAFGRLSVRMRGGCVPLLLLDGMPIRDGAEEMDWLVPVQDVLAVEVYTGVAGMPAQFVGLAGGSGGGCGAVALWTKR